MLFRHMSKRLERIEEALGVLLYRTETIMASLDDIRASQAAEDKDIASLIGAVQAGSAALKDASAQIDALKAQIAAGQGIDTAALDAIKSDMDARKADMDAALPAPPPDPAAPAPGG